MKARAWKQTGVVLLACWLAWPASLWAQRPVEVQAITACRGSSGFRIEVLGSGPLQPKTRMLSGPEAIVVDLIGAVPAEQLPEVHAEQDGIFTLRTVRLQENPPVTRLVAYLAEPGDFDLATEGNRLFIDVHPVSAAPDLQRVATTAPRVPAPAPKSVSATPSIPAELKPAEVQNLAVYPAEAGVRIEVSASGPIQPRTMRLTGPDRIVVDLPDAVPGTGLHRVTVNRNGIIAVRVGRFQDDPPVTRLVVDIPQPSDFELLPQGNNLTINVHPSAATPLSVQSKAALEVRRARPTVNPKFPSATESGAGTGSRRKFGPLDAMEAALAAPNVPPARPETQATTPVAPQAPPSSATVPLNSPEAPPAPPVVWPAVPSLLVTKIVTDKSEILTEEEIRNIVSHYENKQATQAELAQLVDEFNRLYTAKGFTTARAVLPAQTVRDGVVNIRLIEGRAGQSNRAEQHPYPRVVLPQPGNGEQRPDH